jgi:hypothetical protein
VQPGKNRLRIRVGNLIANNLGVQAEAGLFGPVSIRSQPVAAAADAKR